MGTETRSSTTSTLSTQRRYQRRKQQNGTQRVFTKNRMTSKQTSKSMLIKKERKVWKRGKLTEVHYGIPHATTGKGITRSILKNQRNMRLDNVECRTKKAGQTVSLRGRHRQQMNVKITVHMLTEKIQNLID